MNQFLRAIIRKTPVYHTLRNWMVTRLQKKEFIEWKKNGKPVPPPHIVKQQVLKSFANKFGLKILVETGTYYGDMVEAMKNNFDRIYSIELSRELYEKAKKRFKDEQQIELINGDSAVELKKIIDRLDQPTLFWLDGHYSGGETAKGDKVSPIYEELAHIFRIKENMRYVIIIDDARLFGSDPGYPRIEDLVNFIKSKRPEVCISIENDSIRITPGE